LISSSEQNRPLPAIQFRSSPIISPSICENDGSTLVCLSIHPAYGCGAPEMWLLTACYIFECIITCYFLIAHFRTPLNPEFVVDSYLFFWVTTLAWSLYHALIGTVYFDWTISENGNRLNTDSIGQPYVPCSEPDDHITQQSDSTSHIMVSDDA
jgi:hypothetical protein